jgi:hypothetical protein
MREEPAKPTGPGPLLTNSHQEVITRIWKGMDDQYKKSMMLAIIEGIRNHHPEDPGGELRLSEVIRASWAIGFHDAMTCIEAGCLIKTGPVNNPEKN